MFRRAHRQGPRWADPLKSLGDVHAARGEWRVASERYEAAQAFAPSWIALRRAAQQAGARAEQGRGDGLFTRISDLFS